MIERQTIEGRPASIIYLDADFNPAHKDTADAARIVYDNGDSALLFFTTPARETKTQAADRVFKLRTLRDAAFKEEKHPRGKGGRFTSGGHSFTEPSMSGHFAEVNSHDPKKAVHFVGFREGERYHNAIKVFGKPDFVHHVWDIRAKTDIAPGDTVVFAKGDETKEPTAYCYDDSNEPGDPAALERKQGKVKGMDPTTDAFKEEEHKRDESGKFTGSGSENPVWKKHIEEGHQLAVKHGFNTVRGPEDADTGTSSPGPYTIYTKGESPHRHILRFYTKHDWHERGVAGPEPLWYAEQDGKAIEGIGNFHENLEEYLEKNHPTHDAFKEEEHPRIAKGKPGGGEFLPASEEESLALGKLPLGKKSSHLVYAPDRNTWPEHIKALAVPPAWTQVHISMDPTANLQVLGYDDKHRRQPKYLQKFKEGRAAGKFANTKGFLKKYDSLIAKNEKNLTSKDARTREHAQVTALLFEMALRPGSERDTGAEKQAYGATTLRAEHVVKKPDGVYLEFTAKEGILLTLPVENKQLAKDLEERAKKGGQLFPTINEKSLLAYVKTVGGAEFKSKDIRTLVATRTANNLVETMTPPKSTAEYKKKVNEIGDIVSKKLGNTRAMALNSYIAPFVFAPWAAFAPVLKPKSPPLKKAA